MSSALLEKISFSTVRVGVTVLVHWQKKLLLAKREGSHGAGTWDTPGGHLDPGEDVRDCAMRETQEETNIILPVEKIIELGFTEDLFLNEKKHYISCVVACEVDGAVITPRQNEPHKFSTDWQWHAIENLPQPLFIPLINALDKFNALLFKK